MARAVDEITKVMKLCCVETWGGERQKKAIPI